MRCSLACLFLFVHGWLLGQDDLPAYYRMDCQAFYKLPGLLQPMNLGQPDYELLDAALFHVTNEVREKADLPSFGYSGPLHGAAVFHAQSMINLNFYDHENKTSYTYWNAANRIKAFKGDFDMTAENIAQFQTVDTPYTYCPRRQPDGTYQYLNCDTEKPCSPYTYLAFARRAVKNWMDSPSHRANILNPKFTSLGCAARFVHNPYDHRQAPFSRPVQNFGGYLPQLDKLSRK